MSRWLGKNCWADSSRQWGGGKKTPALKKRKRIHKLVTSTDRINERRTLTLRSGGPGSRDFGSENSPTPLHCQIWSILPLSFPPQRQLFEAPSLTKWVFGWRPYVANKYKLQPLHNIDGKKQKCRCLMHSLHEFWVLFVEDHLTRKHLSLSAFVSLVANNSISQSKQMSKCIPWCPHTYRSEIVTIHISFSCCLQLWSLWSLLLQIGSACSWYTITNQISSGWSYLPSSSLSSFVFIEWPWRRILPSKPVWEPPMRERERLLIRMEKGKDCFKLLEETKRVRIFAISIKKSNSKRIWSLHLTKQNDINKVQVWQAWWHLHPLNPPSLSLVLMATDLSPPATTKKGMYKSTTQWINEWAWVLFHLASRSSVLWEGSKEKETVCTL